MCKDETKCIMTIDKYVFLLKNNAKCCSILKLWTQNVRIEQYSLLTHVDDGLTWLIVLKFSKRPYFFASLFMEYDYSKWNEKIPFGNCCTNNFRFNLYESF